MFIDMSIKLNVKYIIELLGHCKGIYFNIHTLAWFGFFICSRKEIRLYIFGEDELRKRSAFHENPDRIYTELTLNYPKSA